jgi:hypothetical protein
MYRSRLLLRSLEYASYATLQEKQKRNEVNIRSVDRGTRLRLATMISRRGRRGTTSPTRERREEREKYSTKVIPMIDANLPAYYFIAIP